MTNIIEPKPTVIMGLSAEAIAILLWSTRNGQRITKQEADWVIKMFIGWKRTHKLLNDVTIEDVREFVESLPDRQKH
jgi:hypothetical protein